jgi:hypothetical protein
MLAQLKTARAAEARLGYCLDVAPNRRRKPFDARCARVTFPAKQKADSAQGPKRKAAPGKRKQQGASAERLPSSGKKSKEREAKLIERLLYSEDAFDSEDERA